MDPKSFSASQMRRYPEWRPSFGKYQAIAFYVVRSVFGKQSAEIILACMQVSPFDTEPFVAQELRAFVQPIEGSDAPLKEGDWVSPDEFMNFSVTGLAFMVMTAFNPTTRC